MLELNFLVVYDFLLLDDYGEEFEFSLGYKYECFVLENLRDHWMN